MQPLADEFVRVRLTQIQNSDIGLFEFDYDITMSVFFLNADEQIYGRYCGRDARDAEHRQSLAGLRYAMQAALDAHRDKVELPPRPESLYVRQLSAFRRYRGCIHCHQVKEIKNAELKATGQWSREKLFRYPLPDNLGLVLEVDRGDVVRSVEPASPADRAGLEPGDVIERLNGHRVASLADATYALDKAPPEGQTTVSWLRDGRTCEAQLQLPAGWRRSDISWRQSLFHMVPAARMYGKDLPAEERAQLGLAPGQLAFRQKDRVHEQAQAAGIRAGDIIIGLDDKQLELTAYEMLAYVRRNYIVGDVVKVNLVRDGKRISREMKLLPF